jgi:putative acetyltransferase
MSFHVEQIDHVELYVPDRYQAAMWYNDVLGLSIVKELEHWAHDPSGPLMIATLWGQTKLALFQGPTRGSQAGNGFHLVAFKTSAKSFISFLDRLPTLSLHDCQGRLVQPELVRDHGAAMSIYFNDPYGNQLEITTYEHERLRKLLAIRNKLVIRETISGDEVLLADVVRRAFEECDHGHHGEADLDAAAKRSGISRLSLVALLDEKIVGHILFTEASLCQNNNQWRGKGLAPLSVLPEYQNHGIGSALIRTGLDALWKQNDDFVIVLGDPEFYSRYGFSNAEEFGIRHGFASLPQEYFMVQFRPNFAVPQADEIRAYYADIFGPQHN